jgi:hypothetical protein
VHCNNLAHTLQLEPRILKRYNTLHTVEVREVQGCSRFKFNFSARMNTMELVYLGGLQQMCMFHEPKGGGPLKSHCPVSRLGQPGTTSSEKVNWSTFNFNTTSREHTNPENARICRKSLPKSEKMHVSEALSGYNPLLEHLIPVKRGVIESGSSYNPVLIRPGESEGHKLDFLFPLLTSTVCIGYAG